MIEEKASLPVDAHPAYRSMKIELEKLYQGGDPFVGERELARRRLQRRHAVLAYGKEEIRMR
jgi:hypothetical protein